jgi:DNA repair ATPase RecN
MITVEQIKNLDNKVQAAVNRISTLKGENASLKGKLDEYQKRIGELEVMIERFKKDQQEIEDGILRALEQLDHLEDSDQDSAVPEQDAGEVSPEELPEQDESELDIF